jgi:hypothetical protein
MTGPRRLVLDVIPADFDPATHAAFGPWCFFKAEEIYPEWENLTFVDAFPTPAERCAAGEACRALAHQLLDRLWPQMNARHGTTHGRDYWHVVLMDWLMHLAMLGWRLWRYTEVFIARAGSEPFDVPLVTANGRFRFASTHAFVTDCFATSDFRAWLIGEIVRRQAPAHWRLGQRRSVEPAAVAAPVPAPRRRQAVEGIGGLGRWQGMLSVYANLLPGRRSRPRHRSKPATVDFPAAFLDLANELADSTCPESLRSGYAALEQAAAAHRYRRGRIYATNINIHDDQTSVMLARAAEAGERIVAVQHGGSYGWAALVPLLAEVEYRHDAFVTWGWREHDDYQGNFAPLPYPLLSRNLGAHKPTDDHMLLVGAVMYSFNPRFDLYPDMLRYRPRKREFLAALPHQVRAKVRYRPYYLDDSFDDAAYLRGAFPDLKVHQGELLPSLMRIKLAVLDHHTTTLAITMAANVPTVCFWDETAWPIGRTARPLFERLKRAGIVFDAPADAARHIASIWSHVHEWWAGADVQSARRDWCREYARASRIWPLHWMKGLAALACVR